MSLTLFAVVFLIAGTTPSFAEVSAGNGTLEEAASSSMTHCVHKCETYNECAKSLDNLSCENGCVAQCKCLSVKVRMLNAHKRSCMSMLQARRHELADKFHKRHQTGLLQTGKKAQEPSFREYVSVSDAFGPEEKPQPVKPHMLNAHRRQVLVSFMAARKRALKRRHRAAMKQRRPTHQDAKGLAEVVSGIDGAAAAKTARPLSAKAADVKKVQGKPAPSIAKKEEAKKVPEKPVAKPAAAKPAAAKPAAAKPAAAKASVEPVVRELKTAEKKPAAAKPPQSHQRSFLQIENAD